MMSCRMATVRGLRALAAVGCLQPVPRRTFMAKHVRAKMQTFRTRKRLDTNVYDPRRSSFLEWNYSAELFAFTARLGETVQEELLRIAFTDKSYVLGDASRSNLLSSGVNELTPVDNGELSVHGSSVATDYIKGWLRAALPRLPEEGVQAITDYLMSSEQLSKMASGLGMKDLILCDEYPPSDDTFSRSLQAFVGAVAESASSERAELLVRDLLLAPVCVTHLHDMWPLDEPEAVLLECAARCRQCPPEPRLIRCAGPNSILSVYVVGFYLDRRLLGEAPGSSVDEARHLAARAALDRLMEVDARPLNIGHHITPRRSPAVRLAEWKPF